MYACSTINRTQANRHTYIHTHTLFENNFSNPGAGCRLEPALKVLLNTL